MSNKITDEDIENAIVKLKPVLGIKPGVYLTVIYSLILLMGLFMLLIYPGLKNNGTYISVETFPEGSLVYVDNIYKGSTPADFFILKGNREIRIEKKYFTPINVDKQIDGRIFGSLIFPGKLKISDNMVLTDPEGFLKDRFRQISSYALIKDYYERYQMPPLISTTVREFLAGGLSKDSNLLYSFLYNMRVNLGSLNMVEDFITAVGLASGLTDTRDILSQPDFSIIFKYFKEKENYDQLIFSIISAYPETQRNEMWKLFPKIEGISKNVSDFYETLKNKEISNGQPQLNDKKLLLKGNTFIGISRGIYTGGKSLPDFPEMLFEDDYISSFPHNETVNSFFIMEKEVTGKEYSLFLDKNPKWRKDNIEQLISNKLVNKDYLFSQDLNDYGKPVANVSWFAAKAYCDWLETQLPDKMTEYEVRLPTEAEWEAAALLHDEDNNKFIFNNSGASSGIAANFSRKDTSGLYDIMGNLWEWNENWYFPTDSINGSFGLPDNDYRGVEKAVKGGSWANSISAIKISTRGSQDPSWCTPFLGFRPVVVKK